MPIDAIALAENIRSSAPSFKTADGTTIYVVEKCIQLTGNEVLGYSRAMLADKPATGSAPLDLVAATIDGKPMRWKAGTRLNWLFDANSFPDEQTAEAGLKFTTAAAAEWNQVAEELGVDIRFGQVADAGSAVFRVEYQSFGNPGLYAVAFFPHDVASKRVVRVGPALFAGTEYDSVGVMRHELGHVLGFRHEHIRPENPRQIEPWVVGKIGAHELTNYDASSLMHYPLLPGFGTKDFQITDKDREGFQALYSMDSSDVREFEFRSEEA